MFKKGGRGIPFFYLLYVNGLIIKDPDISLLFHWSVILGGYVIPCHTLPWIQLASCHCSCFHANCSTAAQLVEYFLYQINTVVCIRPLANYGSCEHPAAFLCCGEYMCGCPFCLYVFIIAYSSFYNQLPTFANEDFFCSTGHLFIAADQTHFLRSAFSRLILLSRNWY